MWTTSYSSGRDAALLCTRWSPDSASCCADGATSPPYADREVAHLGLARTSPAHHRTYVPGVCIRSLRIETFVVDNADWKLLERADTHETAQQDPMALASQIPHLERELDMLQKLPP